MIEVLLESLPDALESGLPLSVAFLGVWLVFRTQHDFDLTVDASLTLGAAASAVWILAGHNPIIGAVVGATAGGLAGSLTYAVMRLLKLSLVLSSIIVGVGLFSVNLRILGRPNVNLLGEETILGMSAAVLPSGVGSQTNAILTFALSTGAVFLVAGWLLKSEAGLMLRASGASAAVAKSHAASPELAMFSALVLGNALTGLSGSLLSQQQGFADVNMGIGTIIFGVTAILVGEAFVRPHGPIGGLLAVLIGTVAYRYILAIAFRLGVPPQDFRGLTAGIVIVALLVHRMVRVVRSRSDTRSLDEPSAAGLQLGAERSSPS